MRVKILKKDINAVMPVKAHTDDYCYDVVATSCTEIAPNVYRYGTGLAFEIVRPKTEQINLSIDFRPRSSVWRTGMVLSNCTGTIDEGYRGEVCAVFYHLMPDMPKYEVGDRIGQIKLGCCKPMEFEWATELEDSDRGDGGYGSTGR